MQRLPVELHARIFVACLPDGPYAQPTEKEAPLLLTAVCRRWREVAHRTPQLWCSLDTVQDIGCGELDTVRPERMGFYRSWLSRAGNRPLSLGVSISDHPWLRDEWLEAIRCYRKRFERLRIVDGAGLGLNALLDGAQVLKHLAIQARFEEGEPALVIAQPLPCLQTLVLDLLHASPATLLEAGWANLTRLSVRLPDGVSYAADEFLRLLDRCAAMESLVFGPLALRRLRQPPRPHPNLRTLSVIFDDAGGDSDSEDDGEEGHDGRLPVLFLSSLLCLKVSSCFEGDLEDALESEGELRPFALNGRADSSEQGSPSATGAPERACSMRVEGGGFGDQCLAMFDPCWTNITHLNVKVAGNTGVLGTVLTLCPNLHALSLYGPDCSSGCTSLPAPLTHCVLASLSITAWPKFGNVLLMATLPGLRKLRVIAICYGEPEDVRDLVMRLGCPLEVLEVKARGSRVWTKEEEEELWELVPTLTEVALDA